MFRNPLYPRAASLTGPDPFARTKTRPAAAGPDEPGTARALIRSAVRAATVKLDEVAARAATGSEAR
jgi:hypothetical protein